MSHKFRIESHFSFTLYYVYRYKLMLIFIVVFRAGEQGRFWYAVLGGSLEVRYHAPDTENKVWIQHLSILYIFVFHWHINRNMYAIAIAISNKIQHTFRCFFLLKNMYTKHWHKFSIFYITKYLSQQMNNKKKENERLF